VRSGGGYKQRTKMARIGFALLGSLALTLAPQLARATTSAELYSSTSYNYGRFDARVRFAAGDGVISSFFMWKDGSEKSGTFWNELDFEKLGADCHLETNPIFGNPSANHSQKHALAATLCDTFHVYSYEWTPDYIAWLVDDVEIRRETADTAKAYADNASAGMQIHFNIWPGDATFGGNFSPTILPVYQYVDWVQFSAYSGGAFTLSWREDFNGASVPANWLTGSWGSPKNLSTHDPRNVNFVDGCAVLSLTADDATGAAAAPPCNAGPSSGTGGTSSGGAGTTPTVGGGGNAQSGGAQTAGVGGALPSSGVGGSPPGTAVGGDAPVGVSGTSTSPAAPTSQASSAGGCSLVSPDRASPLLSLLGALALAAFMRARRA